ncbi:hypothetical protein BC659_0485 [Sediminibacterium goheungense]|uniref:Uncharacterized protein n=1 Tax=Sediminibacterium goheungense TaxID=1086393 RepID=A0A4R6IZU2_9BACT|nr:hypothetical protein BC659_0485 [Sediminibacterium goheungense]
MIIATSFMIQVKYISGLIKLRVRKVHETALFEFFEVQARNKKIIFRNNRPLLKSKGLHKKRIDWKLIEGTLANQFIQEEIPRKLNEYFSQNEIKS